MYSMSDTSSGWEALKASKAGLDRARLPATSMMLSFTGFATFTWAAAPATRSDDAKSRRKTILSLKLTFIIASSIRFREFALALT